ncbi:TPA: D-alanine--D-alanine ligase [Vibrio vulnificus]|nr:D-alanine--D-alanine ligase [Vibrio vulnificus]
MALVVGVRRIFTADRYESCREPVLVKRKNINMNRAIEMIEQGRVNAGMPLLSQSPKREISPYEFLPSWFFYTPVVAQSVVQGLWHRDITLPLIANPAIHLSGMVGESKHDILTLAGKEAQRWISPFITVSKHGQEIESLLADIEQSLLDAGLTYPLVAKPDLGCRGAGVKLIETELQLRQYLDTFPQQARFLLQQKAPFSAEAGVFYVRHPQEKQGRIISITLKYAPSVVGDGQRTLKALIEDSPRAGKLTHLYFPRHSNKLDWVPGAGEEVQLAFAGSHSRGSIFRNGNQYITPELTQRLDAIFDDFNGFHYGRLDIKFADIEQFMAGENFTILEVNGASSEAAHIWDSETPLLEIFSTLLLQYRLLFQIGAQQKKLGHRTPKIRELLRAWQTERQLVRQYPATD